MNIYEATKQAAQRRGLTEEIRIPVEAYTDPHFDTVVEHVGREKFHGAMITVDGDEAVVFYTPTAYIDIVDLLQHTLLNYSKTQQRLKSALAQKRGFAKDPEAREQARQADEKIVAASRHYVWTLAAIR